MLFTEVSRNDIVSSFMSGNPARYFGNGFYAPYFSFLPAPPHWIFVTTARMLFFFSFLSLIGLFTSVSLRCAVGCFFYLFFLNKFFYLNHFYSLGLALFLCSFMPCAEIWSCDAWMKIKKGQPPPKYVISWAARLMQVMVSVIYIGSATSKVYPE